MGDVFFLGSSTLVRAHLGGFADSSNTLRIAFDDQSPSVEAAFAQRTFESAPTPVPTPAPIVMLAFGLAVMTRFAKAKPIQAFQ